MFSNLKNNSNFYILDKTVPELIIGKVSHVTGVDYGNPLAPTVKLSINTDKGLMEFRNIPANISIANDDETNYIISENMEDMANATESLVNESKHVLDTVPYHKKMVEEGENILVKLNPKIAKEKERDNRIDFLETKVTGIADSLSNITVMMNKLLNKNIGDNNNVHGRDNREQS